MLPQSLSWLASPLLKVRQHWQVLAIAVLLVTVPVFIQAPLVRIVPWVGLGLTGGWVALGWYLYQRSPRTRLWGDLILGFAWTWLAGSIYWGWFRWEPTLHLPIEAIGLPIALWCLSQRKFVLGHWFYLGSLLGTATTDVYFYLVDLIPHWRHLMAIDPQFAAPIFHQAIAQMNTPQGFGWAIVLVAFLISVGTFALKRVELCRWAFGGAVLSTLLVDGLFWVAAIAA